MPAAKSAASTASKTSAKPGKNATTGKPPRTIAGTVAPQQDELRQEILRQYEEAVRAMQQGNYAAAHPALEKLLQIAPPEFVDRIRMYLAACVAQANRKTATFTSAEEKYDYAISLLNDGQFEDAREHLNEILDGNSEADYAFYGLAVLASVTGDSHNCLEKLTEAIRLNGQNRILARSDSDFQDMSDDPRFTELLYPEA
ncbi:TPR end-of-group domain-containing protein [Terriglobus roseus]|uniref:Tetratricopeptide repeat-containing protein n=1 Tax=Terriglobus roseus TaxID=392734 RepID=A0A1G7JPF1_9BACT|nr:tetratricopeptide repeat protein [Terriglobus roseus]SDF26807.1 Tetratricopeptide repeat-containing protein [Terriglobus roseus]